ncbi:hypothetical protein [Deinococcus soli (ex Cha et al. 2016)]|uniref:Uncharacterized protein n=2 Tax=Deinococcus soli (ex Cha et al. 2016) TaxID=1309411 RepID=A0AAE3XB07_9DEIO|nr:hypothetical protein [Deinococcus soli (ex Cha et al. 2016)]MDR6218157.1 hypothetical protein [Deinococcus soli (ex Cha et al. 2016)]MDR6328897.1 hypothetical protein [Deinococcus soli (ex Cha et al. 2016)]MDR6751615.1 hypothetical protein [Deinococcus soli (ex Cha et al. 2016)]
MTLDEALRALEGRIQEFEDDYYSPTDHVHAEFRKVTRLTGRLARRTTTHDWDDEAMVAYSHQEPEEEKVFVCLLRRYQADNSEQEVTLAAHADLTQCLLAAAERLALDTPLTWEDPAAVRAAEQQLRQQLFTKGLMGN